MIVTMMALSVLGMPPSLEERVIVEQAMTCRNARAPDPWFLLSVLRLEEAANVPDSMRGITLSTGCVESGYYPRALGDCNYGYGKCMAKGFAQLWPWWERRYGVDRFNAHHSVETYLFHVTRQLKKTRRICKHKGEKLWRTAEARAVRSGGKKRCGESTAHYRLLKKWKRVMRRIWEAPHHPLAMRTQVKKNSPQCTSGDAQSE